MIHANVRPRSLPLLLAVLGLLLFVNRGSAQVPDTLPSATALKRLSLEELMSIEVTSVSKRPERLSETASAIQVITSEDIRRSGVTSLPEALRLAANLMVAQVNASQWAISARGFNNVLANKLLVLIDGRTIYTPLYAGVFWDVQNPPLESIDRIEIISGPGGALWGANAVNGVINVITKKASETRGLFLEGAVGTELLGSAGVRYGGQLGAETHGRVYGQAFGRDNTVLTNGDDAKDSWHLAQGGFRIDRTSSANLFTLQGDYYDGRPDPDGGAPVLARGGNVILRWNRTISEGSDFQAQVYYDRAYRDFRNEFTEDLAMYDGDVQHRFQLGSRQEVIWGLGVRIMDHRTTNLPDAFEFLPEHRTLHLYNGFVQDEIFIVRDRFHIVLGTKIERNDYTGTEFQPNLRLTWSPSSNHTVWGAVSRAVRTPSRLDRDFVLSLAPGVPFIMGTDFDSEELLAYELGWRVKPSARSFASVSTYYNDYDNLRTVEPGPPPTNLPITFGNGVRGHSYGVELAMTYQLTDDWRLRGGYTFFKKDLSVKPGSQDANQGSAEADDPEHQAVLHSIADLSRTLETDVVIRYVDALPSPSVPSYISLDLRLAWKPTSRLEIALVGQNLLEHRHAEFIPSSPSPREIERAVYGRITWR